MRGHLKVTVPNSEVPSGLGYMSTNWDRRKAREAFDVRPRMNQMPVTDARGHFLQTGMEVICKKAKTPLGKIVSLGTGFVRTKRLSDGRHYTMKPSHVLVPGKQDRGEPMKDIMGQELAVGDIVVWGVKSGLRWGKVIEIDSTKRGGFGVRTQIGTPHAGKGGWMRGEGVAKVMDP